MITWLVNSEHVLNVTKKENKIKFDLQRDPVLMFRQNQSTAGDIYRVTHNEMF